MKPNMNEETGIHYGIIRANSLDWELVDIFMHGFQTTNLSYQEAYAEIAVKVWREVLDGDSPFEDAESAIESLAEEIEIEEPIVEGTYAGVNYRSSWLGGALHFFIFDSPCINRYALCSPCVPNAGDLDSPDIDGVETYDVHPDWRREE